MAALLVALAVVLVWAVAANAHGVDIEYTSSVSVEVVAKYDSGEPMSGAQVAVYAPGDPATPWITGFCDDEGRFTFSPDTTMPGTWSVQVRQAGHGDIVHIPVGTGGAAAECSEGLGTGQIVLIAVCVVWGATGTALYFRRRRT
jgi:nickel transport protein